MSKAQRLKAARRERRLQADRVVAAAQPRLVAAGATSRFGYPAIYLLLAIAVGDYFTFADSDIWGHIRFGQAMLTAGHLVRHDPYSYSAPGHLWRNHEWLSEVFFALAYNWGGVFGLESLKLCCSTAMVLLLALAVAETQALPAIQAAVVMLTAPAMAAQVQMRPQLFTFILMAALAWLLAANNYRSAGRLWLVVPIMALWANFHGGYVAGLGAIGIYAAAVSIEVMWLRRDWRRAVHLSLVVCASALATLLNPYGVGAWYAVWHALTNPLTRSVINDWKPVTEAIAGLWKTYLPGAIIFAYALGFLLALVLAVALAPFGGDFPLIVVAATFSVAALVSLRNLALAIIVTSVPLARHLGLVWQQRSVGALRKSAMRDSPAATGIEHAGSASREIVGQLFAATAAILLIVDGLFAPHLEAIVDCPAGAVAFMKKHDLHGNVLSTYDWGEYLIWHLGAPHLPESKVFIDGRYDTVYPDTVIDDYFNFEIGFPNPERVLTAYRHDFVLIPPATGLYQLMSAHLEWKVLYHDENAVLFAPKDFSINGVTTPVIGAAPPSLFP